MSKIAILGSGSWGTALAQVLADNNQDVLIWGISDEEIQDINNHKNSKYFPNIDINPSIKATINFEDIKDRDIILIATPSITIEGICQKINELIEKPVVIVNVAKGFHPISHKRMSEVIKESMDPSLLIDIVSLIGPSHAEEVVIRLLTTVNAVCENEESAKLIQDLFSNSYFRVYTSYDVVGSEYGVALKNVIALASGISSGIGLGDNARAALMTRGLAEIARYGTYFGGEFETYLGLTGVGDLIVTCTSHHSRNFQAGYQIGKENSAEAFLENNSKTVEGIRTAEIVYHEAKKHDISMPIIEAVYKVIYEGVKPTVAVEKLMQRDLKDEN